MLRAFPLHFCYIREFQSNSNVLYLINCGNKSKCFCVFFKFYFSFTTQSTSSYISKTNLFYSVLPSHVAYAPQYKLLSSFTNNFTAKAVPNMLSSVLTDVMQMLPSAVNTHTRSNKYQYMFVEKPLYNMPFLQN